MTRQQGPDRSRGLTSMRNPKSTASSLDAAEAHLFGVGVSVVERQSLTRRGMAQLVAGMPNLWEQIARRCIQQAIAEAMPTYWLARAEELERVGTPWADEAAMSCRRHGWILATSGLPGDLQTELDAAVDAIVGVG